MQNYITLEVFLQTVAAERFWASHVRGAGFFVKTKYNVNR